MKMVESLRVPGRNAPGIECFVGGSGAVRIGRSQVEIAMILDGIAARLGPYAHSEPVGSVLQNQLCELTAALRESDIRRASTALSLTRALAIGRQVLAASKEGPSASSADTMTLAVNLEAAEALLSGMGRQS